MNSTSKPTLDAFMGLVRSRPTQVELQGAIDRQDFLAPLTVAETHEDGATATDTGLTTTWSGSLGDRPIAFRLGFVPPAQLPGSLSERPKIRAWPLGIWTDSRGDGRDVAAGALALLAWIVETGGVGYWGEADIAAVRSLPSLREHVESIAAASLGRMHEFANRYPSYPRLEPGPHTVVTTVHR